MLTGRKLWSLVALMAALSILAAIACSSDPVEVEVTRVVTEEVERVVEVTRVVPGEEVERVVTEVVTEVQEVEKEVIVEVLVTPPPGEKETIIFGGPQLEQRPAAKPHRPIHRGTRLRLPHRCERRRHAAPLPGPQARRHRCDDGNLAAQPG